jgi:hypothetical protein
MSHAERSEKQVAELKQAVEKLTSKKENERLAAQATLDELGVNKLDTLLDVLQKEVAERRKRQRWVYIGIAAYFGLMLLVAFLPMLFGEKPETGFLSTMASMGGVIAGMLAVSSAQKNATRALGEFDDKQTVGAWALALEYDDKEVVAMAREKLPKLLPQLNASDAHLLDEDQRTQLYKALHKHPNKKNPNITLHQAILKALQQVGDEKALPHVEKLAKGEGIADRFPELKVAAEACLPFLTARVEQIRASQTLLRASSAAEAPSAGSDVLLRPALDAGATPAQELLRASQEAQRKDTQTENSVMPSGAKEVEGLLQNRNT